MSIKLLADYCSEIFNQSINLYHEIDDVEATPVNPFTKDCIEFQLFEKNWIDTVQWHLEDLIRDPGIDQGYGIFIKRRIDKLNQLRTNIVEWIDDYIMGLFKEVTPGLHARHNTESVGWALDRLSILNLKIFHVRVELERNNSTEAHRRECQARMHVLLQQHVDLLQSINWLLEDIANGVKRIKVYKQLKMYNDAAFNPVLYNSVNELNN